MKNNNIEAATKKLLKQNRDINKKNSNKLTHFDNNEKFTMDVVQRN